MVCFMLMWVSIWRVRFICIIRVCILRVMCFIRVCFRGRVFIVFGLVMC